MVESYISKYLQKKIHKPWFLTGVTAPLSRQSTDSGTSKSGSMNVTASDLIFDLKNLLQNVIENGYRLS